MGAENSKEEMVLSSKEKGVLGKKSQRAVTVEGLQDSHEKHKLVFLGFPMMSHPGVLPPLVREPRTARRSGAFLYKVPDSRKGKERKYRK